MGSFWTNLSKWRQGTAAENNAATGNTGATTTATKKATGTTLATAANPSTTTNSVGAGSSTASTAAGSSMAGYNASRQASASSGDSGSLEAAASTGATNAAKLAKAASVANPSSGVTVNGGETVSSTPTETPTISLDNSTGYGSANAASTAAKAASGYNAQRIADATSSAAGVGAESSAASSAAANAAKGTNAQQVADSTDDSSDIDYDQLIKDLQTSTARDNAVNTKQASDAAAEAAYNSGITLGSEDWQSFLDRSTAAAQSENITANEGLADDVLAYEQADQAQTEANQDDYDSLYSTLLSQLDGNTAAQQALATAYANGEDLNTAYQNLWDDSGVLLGSDTYTAYQAAIADRDSNSSSAYAGMTDDEVLAAVQSAENSSVLSALNEQTSESETENTVAEVADAVTSGSLSTDLSSGTLSIVDLNQAVTSDTTAGALILAELKAQAVASAGYLDSNSDDDQATFMESALTAGNGGFVTDASGNLYLVSWDISGENPTYALTVTNVETMASYSL